MTKKLIEELHAFCETTSVRGIPRVMKAKTRVTFVVWLLAVLTCAGVLVWQLSVVLTRYFQYPVSTLTVQAPASQRPTFPDITVCNLEPLVYNEDFDYTLNTNYLFQLDKYFFPYYDQVMRNKETGNLSTHMVELLSEADVFAWQGTTFLNHFPLMNGFAFNNDDSLVVECLYFDWAGNTYNTNCSATILAAWDPIYYKCFTLQVNETDREKIRGVSMVLYINNYYDFVYLDTTPSLTKSNAYGVRALVHAPGTAPDLSLGMSISSGTETSVLLSQTKRTRLAQPYSNCTDQQHLTGDDTSAAYTLRYCVNTCVQQQIVDVCGCVSSNVPQYSMAQLILTNFSVCGNVSEALDFFITFVCASDIVSNASVNDECNSKCALPCNEIDYVAIPSSAFWPQYAALQEYDTRYIKNNARFHNIVPWPGDNSTDAEISDFWNDINNLLQTSFLQLDVQFGDASFNELKDVAAFSVDAMGAQIGGVLSLWLGVTVMFLFEAFEFLYIYFTGGCKKESTHARVISVAPATEMVSTSMGYSNDIVSLKKVCDALKAELDLCLIKLSNLQPDLVDSHNSICERRIVRDNPGACT